MTDKICSSPQMEERGGCIPVRRLRAEGTSIQTWQAPSDDYDETITSIALQNRLISSLVL